MLSSLFFQAIARGVNILSSFLCAVYIGRAFGAEVFSGFVFAISFINIFSSISMLGFEAAVAKEYFERSLSVRKKIVGLVAVGLCSVLVGAVFVGYQELSGSSVVNFTLLFSLLLCVISFYLSNLIKFESSLYFAEFVRGGGVNTFCLAIIIIFPVSEDLIRSNLLILYSAVCILISSLAFALLKGRLTDPSLLGTASEFIRKGFSLSLPVLFAVILVTGDLVVARLVLSEGSQSSMALLTRISFALATLFVVMNNSISNRIVSQGYGWSLPQAVSSNAVLAVLAVLFFVFFSDPYLSLFVVDGSNNDLEGWSVAAMLLAHLVNLISAGLIPYLICVKLDYFRFACVAAGLWMLVSSSAMMLNFILLPEIAKFSIVFYGTLALFKVLIIWLAFRAYANMKVELS